MLSFQSNSLQLYLESAGSNQTGPASSLPIAAPQGGWEHWI